MCSKHKDSQFAVVSRNARRVIGVGLFLDCGTPQMFGCVAFGSSGWRRRGLGRGLRTCQAETDSNYSLVFPWWDKLFGSYTRQPSHPYEDMTLGLSQYNSEQEQAFLRTLANPFGR